MPEYHSPLLLKYRGPALPKGSTMGFFDWVTANPGLLVFTIVSVAVVFYLLYAMLNPTRF